MVPNLSSLFIFGISVKQLDLEIHNHFLELNKYLHLLEISSFTLEIILQRLILMESPNKQNSNLLFSLIFLVLLKRLRYLTYRIYPNVINKEP